MPSVWKRENPEKWNDLVEVLAFVWQDAEGDKRCIERHLRNDGRRPKRGVPLQLAIREDSSVGNPRVAGHELCISTNATMTAEWRTERVRQVLPHLRAGVGSRPRLPTLHEISRVRYTPITLPFKRVALLSHRIASHLGYQRQRRVGPGGGHLDRRSRTVGIIRAELCTAGSPPWHAR